MDKDLMMPPRSVAASNISSQGPNVSLLQALTREYNPSTVAEALLVEEIVRRESQAADLDAIAASLGINIKRVVNSFAVDQAGDFADLTAAQRLSDIVAQSQRCSKATAQAIGRLLEIGQNRRRLAATGEHDARFITEEQCLAWVIRRFRIGEQACPRCGTRGKGCWIASNRAWECAACQTQIGVRTGSVMENSPLPLTVWFKAIRLVSQRPDMDPRELARQLSIRRVATARSMSQRIRNALDSQPAALLGIADIHLPEFGGRSLNDCCHA